MPRNPEDGRFLIHAKEPREQSIFDPCEGNPKIDGFDPCEGFNTGVMNREGTVIKDKVHQKSFQHQLRT